MTTVVPFTGTVLSAVQRQEPNNQLIVGLEELIDQARSGFVQAVAYATINQDGGTTTGHHYPANTDAITLIGATHLLAADLAQGLLNQQVEHD